MSNLAHNLADPELLYEKAFRRERAAREISEKILETCSRELYLANQRFESQYCELKHALTDLSQTQERLVQSAKMASLGQLVAGIAHEINNPLSFIMSNLGTLAEYINALVRLEAELDTLEKALVVHPSPIPAVAQALKRISEVRSGEQVDFIRGDVDALMAESFEGVHRIRGIVKDLRVFAHQSEGQKICDIDINECIESTLKIIWHELKYKCRVSKNYGRLKPVRAAPGPMGQVFMNLLVNASQSIAEKGEIHIQTACEGRRVVVRIADNGHGIKQEHMERLFDPFFTTKAVGKGTGLGLSIVHGIVQKHHGTIQVESSVGRGTTFTVSLPSVGGAL